MYVYGWNADNTGQERTARRLALGAVCLVLLLALLGLAGFSLKSAELASVSTRSIPMAPLTAVCFVLLSVPLLFRQDGRPPLRRGIYFSAAAVLLISVLASLDYLRLAGEVQGIPLWRMSPLTAAMFVISAAGLLGLLRSGTAAGRVSAALLAVLLLLSFLVLTGYLYGSPFFYGGHMIPVAFPTGAAFFALGVALLASNRGALEHTPFLGGSLEAVLFRNFLPLTALAVLLNGFLNLGGTVLFGSKPVLNAVSALAAMAVTAWLAKRVSLRVGDQITQAQQRQRETERRLSALLSNLPGAAYRCSAGSERRLEFISGGCRALTGYDAADLTAAGIAGISELILPQDRERVSRGIEAAVAAGRQYQLVYSIRARGGETRVVWDQGLALADGDAVSLEGYLSDITEIRRNEELAARTGERLVLAARAAGLGVWDWDIPANKLSWDDRMFELYGVKRSDSPGPYESWLKGLHPEDRDRCERETELALRGDKPYVTEFRVLLPDGAVRYIKAMGDVFRGPDGKALRMIGVNLDVTERKLAEEALRQNGLLLRRTQSLAGIGGWEWNLAGQTMHWTDEMYRLHDLDPAEKGQSAAELIARSQGCYRREDLAEVMAAFNRCVETGVPYDLEFPFTTVKGRQLWVRTTAQAEREGDRIVRVVGTLADITGRKLAEGALENLSRQRELALSAASLGWWTYDPVSKVASYDARYREIFEVTGSSRPNDEILKRLHPEDLPGVWAKVEAALDPADPKPYAAEYRVVIPGGKVKWVEARGLAIFEGEGKDRRAVSLVGTVADVTERRNAEETLRKSENAVRNKLNAIMSPEGDIGSIPLEDIFDIPALQRLMDDMYQLTRITSAILDIKGKVLVASGWQDICTKFHRVNPETCRHCLESDTVLSKDIPPGEVRSYFCKNNMRDVATPLIVGGAHVGNFFLGQFLYDDDPRDTEKFRDQARRYGFNEEEYLAAYARIPVFSRRNVEVLISFYRQVSELISTLSFGKIKLARALAQSRQAELEKEHLNRALAAKNSEMENFLYITTHDLRSPLVNIQGFTQNLQRYLGDIREALAAAVLPQERAALAKKLTDEKVPEALGFVLESSAKMDALISALLKVSRLGRQELKPEPLEMGPMLARIVDTMLFQVREAGAEIRVGTLPPCRADAAAVNQLFSNLLDNAVKYRDSGRALTVEVSGETRGGMAVYRVIDNGPGIPAADAERLWDVFYKPSRPGKKNGEGIGLPMCRRIAERNGGGIRLEPAPGGGSVFVVELPAA